MEELCRLFNTLPALLTINSSVSNIVSLKSTAAIYCGEKQNKGVHAFYSPKDTCTSFLTSITLKEVSGIVGSEPEFFTGLEATGSFSVYLVILCSLLHFIVFWSAKIIVHVYINEMVWPRYIIKLLKHL